MLDFIHILSPALYVIFVWIIQKIPSCRENQLMRKLRASHNIFMSLLSFAMMVGLTIGMYQTSKLDSWYGLFCGSFQNNLWAYWSVQVFLYSKYWEWIDTLFLRLSGRDISWLQYTHHMSTAILVYANSYDVLAPYTSVSMFLNCFVHFPMYWYFAYPRGFLRPYRQIITQIQIVQHIICVTGSIWNLFYRSYCPQPLIGNVMATSLYVMYLGYFLQFYIRSYLRK